MNKKSKEKNSDHKDWEEFLNNPSDIFDKDKLENKNHKSNGTYKFDFHGYSIDNANKKVAELIRKCFEEKFSEILIITGKGMHSDKKNNVYITYLPDATENDILETVDFVSKQELTPITHLPARTMKDLDHVSDFLKELRNRTDSKKILVIGGGGNQNGSVSSSIEIPESGI